MAQNQNASVAVPMKKKSFKRKMAEAAGFWFILPWLVGFIVFKGYPFAMSLVYSFTDYTLRKGAAVTEVGLFNYVDFFTDKDMVQSLVVTFQYAFMPVLLRTF